MGMPDVRPRHVDCPGSPLGASSRRVSVKGENDAVSNPKVHGFRDVIENTRPN